MELRNRIYGFGSKVSDSGMVLQKPYTLNPNPKPLNPKTLNNLNPKPLNPNTLNPKPKS